MPVTTTRWVGLFFIICLRVFRSGAIIPRPTTNDQRPSRQRPRSSLVIRRKRNVVPVAGTRAPQILQREPGARLRSYSATGVSFGVARADSLTHLNSRQ